MYPAAWRHEYGVELEDLLMARPLAFGAMSDVVCAALYQRGRAADAATLMGVMAMIGVSAALAWNWVFPAHPIVGSQLCWRSPRKLSPPSLSNRSSRASLRCC
jgi:hypothetical protein